VATTEIQGHVVPKPDQIELNEQTPAYLHKERPGPCFRSELRSRALNQPLNREGCGLELGQQLRRWRNFLRCHPESPRTKEVLVPGATRASEAAFVAELGFSAVGSWISAVWHQEARRIFHGPIAPVRWLQGDL